MVPSVDLNSVAGLSEPDAIANLKRDGYNELPSSRSRGLLSLVWDSFQDPIFLLLVGGGIIYWILGDLQEALILLGFVVFLTAISLYQEGKTEHALEALRDLSSPRALVIRDGQRKRIAGREVVRDDILMLAEGDRVPADAIVLSCTNLSTDESLLTGESLPVRKIAAVGNVEMARPGGDELPFVYSGTLVVQGQGIVRVRSIGSQTEMGKIGNALQKVQPEVTPLQREMNRLVSRLFGIALALCVAIVIIYGATTGDWLKGVLAGITLAMAILPNEFPVVVTIFLALGAWRISQHHVLARRTSAVETVGSATVLCVDKTGTLTLNQMAVQQLFAYNHAENPQPYDLALHSSEPLPESVHPLVEFCILASQRDPFDPMEKAFKELGVGVASPLENRMSETELQQRIENTNIFARAVPEQKLRIVNALKDKGEVVAMTGDGVNDAPALKAAQIGIAMGQRGTDVARESAALVLLDDDFSSIVQAVKLGRRIFDNLRKAMSYLLAIHIPIAGISLIPVLFKLPLVLLPIYVAFLHLIIDPACSIVLEAEPAEANVMQRPPRNPKEPLFGRKTVGLALLQGSGILVIILAIFIIALNRGQGELDARALTFTTLILASLGLIISESSTSHLSLKILKSPNPTLWWTIGGGIFFLAIVLYVPFLRDLFSFSFLHSIDLAICFGGGVICLLWFELLKQTTMANISGN